MSHRGCQSVDSHFHSTGRYTVDDLLLQENIQDDDRDGGHHQRRHDGTVVHRIGAVEVIGRQRQGKELPLGENQRRQQEVVPDRKNIEHHDGGGGGLDQREHHPEEGTGPGAAV